MTEPNKAEELGKEYDRIDDLFERGVIDADYRESMRDWAYYWATHKPSEAAKAAGASFAALILLICFAMVLMILRLIFG